MTLFPAAIETCLEARGETDVAFSLNVGTGEFQIAKLCLKNKADPTLASDEIAVDELEVDPEM